MKKLAQTQKSVLNMTSSDSQIDKPQRGPPKRAELADVNINTGEQSINCKKASFNTFEGAGYRFYSRHIYRGNCVGPSEIKD